jgi:predicted ATPase
MRLADKTLRGRYEIGALLGAGGMGEVYAGRDVRLDRPVAIKVLPETLAREPERLARLQREARLLAALHHPCIAGIYGLEETEAGGWLLILERVVGETLAVRLTRGPLPPPDAVAVCEQVADALDSAHLRGVIHRDLKPSNIMITPAGRVKVLDFGIAKHAGTTGDPPVGAAAETDITAEGLVVGTPGYMSPEQLRGEPVDARSDIFAFGCVLFECLAGRRAFPGATPLETAALTLRGTVRWELFPTGAPPALRALAAGCLSPERDARPGSMEAARRALRAAGVDGEEPELPPGSTTAHNLPHALARFIGRDAEIAACRGLLAERRLVTLVGIGGTGKTRLAIRIAELLLDEFPDGVWLVDLAPVEHPERVGEAALAALQAEVPPGHPVLDALNAQLRERSALIVLDNCEHVLDAAAGLAESLLRNCPRLRILATSRERLAVEGEQTVPLAPLALPPPGRGGTSAAQSDSVRLFLDRARLIHPGFEVTEETAEAVSEVCLRLDGLPLAIELAASRLRTLSVSQVRALLDDRFRLLVGNSDRGDARHRTLETALHWSYDLLTPPEQELLRHLSVFAGGFSLEGALAVYPEARDDFEALDLVGRLADKSLILVEHRADRTRYRFLETVRQYAYERLVETGDLAEARSRHLAWAKRLAAETSAPAGASEQAGRLARLEEEHENLLNALHACDEAAGGPAAAMEIASHLWLFWSIRGHHALGCREISRVLARPGAETRDANRCRVLYAAGWLASLQGDTRGARPLLLASRQVAHEIADVRAALRALIALGVLAEREEDYATARRCYEESVRINRDLGNQRGIAAALSNLGNLAYRDRDYERSIALAEEALALHRENQDRDWESGALLGIALALWQLGRLAEARRRCSESLAISLELGARHITACAIAAAGYLVLAAGDPERAARLIAAAERQLEDLQYGLSPADRAELEAEKAKLSDALGKARALEILRAGTAMDEASAVRLAQEGLDRTP